MVPHLYPRPGFITSGDDRLAVVIDEMQDLKGVWVELGKIVEQLDEIKDKPWLSVQPRKVSEAVVQAVWEEHRTGVLIPSLLSLLAIDSPVP